MEGWKMKFHFWEGKLFRAISVQGGYTRDNLLNF